jgi:acyl-CoA dehydrogenase
MQTLIWFLYVIATLGAVSYFRMKLFNASVATFCLFILGSILGVIGEFSWVIFFLAALPVNIESVR